MVLLVQLHQKPQDYLVHLVNLLGPFLLLVQWVPLVLFLQLGQLVQEDHLVPLILGVQCCQLVQANQLLQVDHEILVGHLALTLLFVLEAQHHQLVQQDQ